MGLGAHGLGALALQRWILRGTGFPDWPSCPLIIILASMDIRIDWAKRVYLSPGDAGRFFACAVEAKADIPFAVLYATSRTPRPPYDLATAKELVGFEPQESWPQGIEVVGWEPREETRLRGV